MAALALHGCGFRTGLDGFESQADDETAHSEPVAYASGSGGAVATALSSESGGAPKTAPAGLGSYGGTWTQRSSSGTGGRGPGGSGWGASQAVGGTRNLDPLCPASKYVDLGCRAEVMEGAVGLCNGLDDDCDGSVDEGCWCSPGSVKPCFAGPPSRRNVGACRDGMQTCEGRGGTGHWGACLGGISPQTEVCDTIDNDCDGCRDELSGCEPAGSCPASGDSRIPRLQPFDRYTLAASDYYDGDALSYSWVIEGGPCDRVSPAGLKSFDLAGANSSAAEFVPRLSGDYTVSLNVEALSGELFQCNWVVPVRGPGLRIEMCYPESDVQDLDLYLKRLSTPTPWFQSRDVHDPNLDECSWSNCEAGLRNNEGRRADWGYEPSGLGECVGGPQGSQWEAIGYCANPRLDIDNNLQQGVGLPENINLDTPHDGDGFRIMVQNFTGALAHPIVNVYCGGARAATFGAPPDPLTTFSGSADSYNSLGAMWRVADVLMQVSDDGDVTCIVEGLLAAAGGSDFNITQNDPSF